MDTRSGAHRSCVLSPHPVALRGCSSVQPADNSHLIPRVKGLVRGRRDVGWQGGCAGMERGQGAVPCPGPGSVWVDGEITPEPPD